MKIIEWDPSAVERKFNQSFAYTTLEGEEPKWRYIRSVTESGVVTTGGKRYAVTTVQGKNPDYPDIEFYYRPINIGWIHSNIGPLNIQRLQTKSYKIGLSSESHNLDSPDGINVNYTDIDLNPDKQISSFDKGGWQIFSPYFWRNNKWFYFLNELIGFCEQQKLYLNKPSFLPHVKKALGAQWQINC